MTKRKQDFVHFCKFIKKEKLKYHIGNMVANNDDVVANRYDMLC